MNERAVASERPSKEKPVSDELSAEQLQSVSGGGRAGGISGDFRYGSDTSPDLGAALLGGGLGVNPSGR